MERNHRTTPSVLTLRRCIAVIACGLVAFFNWSCGNSPHSEGEAASNTFFTAISTELQNLDPVKSYSSDEYEIVQQIFEPPFQYHYLKRPYEVIPGTATAVPSPTYFDSAGSPLPADTADLNAVHRVEYVIAIKSGIKYAPHPCFAKKPDGTPYYTGISFEDLDQYDYPSAMPESGTRTLTAADYVLQMKRMADARSECPVFESTFKKYVLGMGDLANAINARVETERAARKKAAEARGDNYNRDQDEKENPVVVDYTGIDCSGIQIIDELTYKVTLTAVYPQIVYWLSMPFCAPMPQEALDFYNEPAMVKKQFTAKRCPVGTGPYYLETFRPNEKIVLLRNPNYHDDFYPTEGAPGDAEKGLLVDAGKKLPFIDKQVWIVEKEPFSSWQKFLQGYYDNSAINEEAFEQAVQQTDSGTELSSGMADKGIVMHHRVSSVYYELQFNMLDPVVGGLDEKQCKLRQAMTIAMDFNEYSDIFRNGRGILPNSPVPPSIFGSRWGEEGTNTFVHKWDPVRQGYRVRSVETAKTLLAEAGYPRGLTQDGKPLTVTFNHSRRGDSKFKLQIKWFQKQLARIGVVLEDQGTDRPQMEELRKKGNWQMTIGGWGADYPDPENFLFLFYGPNGQKKSFGMNRCNYENPKFDSLFSTMERMTNSPRRQEIIDDMMDVWAHDAPSALMFYPISFYLRHGWLTNVKLHDNTHNVFKYYRIDGARRAENQKAWNKPVYWPVVAIGVLLIVLVLPAIVKAYRYERGL